MTIRYLLLLILSISLYAKDSKECFSVQLLSVPLSQKDALMKSSKSYPPECKVMQISKIMTLRCGCYESFKETKVKLIKYKEKYHQASIAMTYKYRYKIEYDDNELRLMLQAFLYSQDLKSAEETIQIALSEYPDSLYWNQKMAEVLRWMDRGEEAFKYMEYVYYKTKQQSLSKEIIDYALNNYQYEGIKSIATKTYLNHPTELNKQRMLLVFNNVGEPQKGAEVLEGSYKKTRNVKLLTDLLEIYMEMGDLENAKRIVLIIKKKKLYSEKNIALLSHYYYVTGDIKNSFQVLNRYDFTNSYSKELNKLYSDLSWYLQKYKLASEASIRLINHHDERFVDYERVVYANKTSNREFAMSMTLKAYKKYYLGYLFYSYANLALKEHRIVMLEKEINKIELSNSALKNEANYYLIKARLYKLLKNKDKTVLALEKAIRLRPNNVIVKMQVIDIYKQLSMYSKVRTLLNDMMENQEVPRSYYLPIAALYYTIHDVNQADFYLDKLREMDSKIVNTREFLFLQDDIYKAQFRNEAHLQTLRKIRKLMQKEAKETPELLKNDKFVYDSLRVSLDLDNIDIFKSKLKKAKKIVSDPHYDDISYSYAVKIGAMDMAYEIYLHTQEKPVWLKFANALSRQDHRTKENLLLYYLNEIPRDDASYGAHQEGDIALAQTLAFDSLNENEKNKNAYISMLNYTKERSDLFSAETGYYNRSTILRKYVSVGNSIYVSRGLSIFTNINYYQNSILDNNTLSYVPATTTELHLGAKQIFDKGSVSFTIGQTKGMCSYNTFDIYGDYRINSNFQVKAKIEKNGVAEESIELLLAGKKDMTSVSLVYNMMQSTSVEVKVDKNKYSSQDDVYIGDGTYVQALLGHQLRNGYPDMRLIFFGDYGVFNEEDTNTDKGVIDDLRDNRYKVLPEDFYNLGLSFDYGMQNSTIYTRVWRPYFEVSSAYNSYISGMTYSLNAGYGGKVYLQDHLVFGGNYISDVNGVGGSVFKLFLKYQFLYTH